MERSIAKMTQRSIERRFQILQMIVEGVSIPTIFRMTNGFKNPIVKLLADAGQGCSE